MMNNTMIQQPMNQQMQQMTPNNNFNRQMYNQSIQNYQNIRQ